MAVNWQTTLAWSSAPPEQLYPELPTQPQPDFRMQKVNEISDALNKEVGHYRTVAKKYKRAKKVVNGSAAGSSVLSALFSSASFSSAISVVGLPATIPRGGVGGAFALASSGLKFEIRHSCYRSGYAAFGAVDSNNYLSRVCRQFLNTW